MNKKVANIILWTWLGTTTLLDLSIGLFSFSTLAYLDRANGGTPYDEYNAYNLSIKTIVINQVIISLVVFLFGLAWSGIVLLATERLLVFLNFPTPGNNKFSKLSLGLFKFALLTTILALLIGNIYLIYDQIQGRSAASN
jgi:hypothetical protein